MPRAPRKCPTPGCNNRITNRRYCETHTVHHWGAGGSQRGAEHERWRKAVLTRDKGRCQINGPHCTRRATQADHILNIKRGGARYDVNNGQATCEPCHKAKTQTEAIEGQRLAKLRKI